jgi:Putative prokaryotic signal transducing protein
MAELLRTTDIVLLSYVNSLLSDAGIPALVADVHVSSVEGSIGAFPRRVLIAAEDWNESVAILTEAGLGAHLAERLERSARNRF